MGPGWKRCRDCRIPKPPTEYRTARKRKDGTPILRPDCRDCERAYGRMRYERDRDKYRQWKSEWFASLSAEDRAEKAAKERARRNGGDPTYRHKGREKPTGKSPTYDATAFLAWRDRNGLSPMEFERHTVVSERSIHRIRETGRVSLDLVDRVLTALGLTERLDELCPV